MLSKGLMHGQPERHDGGSMTLAPKYVPKEILRHDSGRNPARPAAQDGSFVITLCSMAAPISLPQQRSPQFTRFNFFFSRTREEGARRYQLHMGYFATPAEAQKWHKILLGIYPDAFVSEAPAAQIDSLSDSQVLRILQDPYADRND
jgi:hypothetical protein